MHPPDREVVGQAVWKHSRDLRAWNHARLQLLARKIERLRANQLKAREGLSAEIDRGTGAGAIEAVVVSLLGNRVAFPRAIQLSAQRADVTLRQHHIAGQGALNIQVVVIGVGNIKIGGQIVLLDRVERHEVHILAGLGNRIRKWICRVGSSRSARDIRKRIGKTRVAAQSRCADTIFGERRIIRVDLCALSLYAVPVQPKSSADDESALPRRTRQGAKSSLRGPGKSNARREMIPMSGWAAVFVTAGIAWVQESGRSPWKHRCLNMGGIPAGH